MPTPSDLTPSQSEAVNHADGALLVLAGPGSGKTRVITRRIARLLEQGIGAHEVLAITFTNKAAGEMEERVAKLIPGRKVWVSTFHRFCARLLRHHGQGVGLQQNFTILDTTDQRTVLKQVLGEIDQDASNVPVGQIAARISRAKNQLITPEIFSQQIEEGTGTFLDRCVAQTYASYQRALLRSNAVDFDDLLMHVALLLRDNPQLRSHLDRRHRFILVDEYQDTNLAQYQIVRALSVDQPNLCVTGDPDQSIYGWRGADIENILRFEQDFPGARIVRLEENFRSTPAILQGADSLIRHNVHRKAKDLFTANPDGPPIELLSCSDATEEAERISARILAAVDEGRCWSEFAILYRVNALSRRLEISMLRNRIPYQVAAGVAFYERAEIKDLLAYLRMFFNPNDEMAFRRVLGMSVQCFGTRKKKILQGISKQTQNKVVRWAAQHGIDLFEAVKQAGKIPALSKQAVPALKRFAGMIEEIQYAGDGSVEGLLRKIIHRTQYTSAWEQSRSEDDVQRLANVEEFLAAARHHDETTTAEDPLAAFLEESSLVADLDSVDSTSGKVTLMTLHAAKGLEFPTVFIVGVEQNLLPHERSLRDQNPRELEEERRLLFVGMTRAMRELSLTETSYRDIHGQTLPTIPSQFIAEIPSLVRNSSDEVPRVAFPVHAPAEKPDISPALTPHQAQIERLRKLGGKPLLTTGAALLSGKQTAADIPFSFKVGMRVRHPQKGVGLVVEVSIDGPRRTLGVHFDSGEESQFLATKCPLQPIAEG